MKTKLSRKKTCKNCKYWKKLFNEADRIYVGIFAGECSNEKFVYNGNNSYDIVLTPRDGVGFRDMDGWAGLTVGEDFGCIHFRKKED